MPGSDFLTDPDLFLEETPVEDIFMISLPQTPMGNGSLRILRQRSLEGPHACNNLSPEDRSFLEDLATYETAFETGVS